MALPMFERASEETVWYGTNAWTTDMYNLELAVDKFEQIKPGTFLMGHTGFIPELRLLFNGLQILMLLVYRDLRDVAVSQAHHIMDDQQGMLNHPGRHLYKGSFDDVLMDVINGIKGYPGVVERWETYEPWMNMPFVHTVRFEDMVNKPHWAAQRFFEWIYGVTLLFAGTDKAYIEKDLKKSIIAWIVAEMSQKQLSSTFRKGKTGSWKREFKPEHVRAFKETDKDNALLRLGFVKKADW
jgi:hypothetical protein